MKLLKNYSDRKKLIKSNNNIWWKNKIKNYELKRDNKTCKKETKKEKLDPNKLWKDKEILKWVKNKLDKQNLKDNKLKSKEKC